MTQYHLIVEIEQNRFWTMTPRRKKPQRAQRGIK
jgi:hypothetical protein